ncbi:hypothetical protein B9T31_16040 [Acinetobacter sp. ANC 4558]|uniref:hypothetical protein n=1 Tax=Acinetobacter sp. ANC 4558 TaxID=1977876 RepID=UPI000A3300EA|nr:hypothetical protein [Acinetobacter sp. ANC 4558]OTG80808.1 hypothetical protein B9T31_16040 [Acinetobacter sp. ANC 4558]
MSWVAVGVAAVAAVGAAYQGYTSHENSKYQSKQAEADAKAVAAQGRLEAERIRRDKTKAQSAAKAAAAENGLDINEGTAVIINDQIEKDGLYDANIAEITGHNSSQRLKGEASVHRKNAQTALIGGAIGSASSGASMYGSLGGWK